MEIYEFENENNLKPVVLGYYEKSVYQKHVHDYGPKSADKIVSTVTNIISNSFNQKENTQVSNNVLLVGKVQSGKTSNLEMLSAILFDNGYNLLIIYGGYDGTLLNQCNERFSGTFDVEDDDNAPILLSTANSSDLDSFDKDFFTTNIEENRPIIITSMKRPVALSKVNEVLKNIYDVEYKAFIIDDEGDQASLNTKKDKANDGSATYKCITEMKNLLHDPLYFSVTATPQANIFQPDISNLKPDSIFLIRPGDGYTGADCYHLREENIYNKITDNDEQLLKHGTLAPSLKNALCHFFIASVLMEKINNKKTDMIVHVYREVIGHEIIEKIIDDYITRIKMAIEIDDPDLKTYIAEIRRCYTTEFFPDSIIQNNQWNDDFEAKLLKIIKKTKTVIQNSQNGISDAVKKTYDHIIYIGGDLLQRGITFKKLVTTYFTRWANSGNMDTTLQRARWFGYRNNYIDLCKVFFPKNIMFEFSNLAEIENDLWEQFELVENKELSINDIIIDAQDTSLNPTRKNVVEIQKTSFSKKWNNQRIGCFNKDSLDKNNTLLDQLISCHKKELLTTTAGRLDNKTSANYFYVSSDEVLSIINQSDFIFDQHPFSKEDLNKVLNGDKICIQLMFDKDDKEDTRKRSFDNNFQISALQQGANSTDPSKITYQGDAYVIADKQCICIQVFRITPKIDNENKNELTQYMYSIHFPKSSIVYRKK